MDVADLTRNVIMYFILPLWLAAGFADYLCHRAAGIETTSGAKESILHLVQFAGMAVRILAAMLLEINSVVIIVMIVRFLLDEVGTSSSPRSAWRTHASTLPSSSRHCR